VSEGQALCLFQRQREGAADKAYPDHDEFVDAGLCCHGIFQKRSGRERLPQRIEETGVLGFESDRYAQMLRHSIGGDRPHNNAGAQ
jgi:hypothetical protein